VEITSKNRLLPIETPDADDQKNALLYSLQTVEAFALYFVVCDPVRTRPRLMDELEERIAPQSVERISVPKETKSLLHFLEKHDFSARPDILFLYGLENQISGAAHPRSHPLLLNLNTSRNSFEAVVPVPIVFFVPVHVMNAIIQGAPDFFSVRSGTYTFALTSEERETLMVTIMERDWYSTTGLLSKEQDEEIQKAEHLLSTYRTLPETERLPQDEVRLLNALATLYQLQHRFTEAEMLFQEALDMTRSALGPNHPVASMSLNNLAVLYMKQDRFSEAKILLEESLKIDKDNYSEHDPTIATAMNNMAGLYQSQGQLIQAEIIFKKALSIYTYFFPNDHPDIANVTNNLAQIYHEQGRYDEAESMYKESLRIRRITLPQNHSSIADTLNNLAGLYHEVGRFVEAENLFKESLKIRREIFPITHTDIAQLLNNLSVLYKAQGRLLEAKSLNNQALEILTSTLGLEHPHTQTVKANRDYLHNLLSETEQEEPSDNAAEENT
jgi:tetratricopeptide (TPR) repeat protein